MAKIEGTVKVILSLMLIFTVSVSPVSLKSTYSEIKFPGSSQPQEYTIVAHKTCKDVNRVSYDCIQPSADFVLTDDSVSSWTQLDNVCFPHKISWTWFDPTGRVYSKFNSTFGKYETSGPLCGESWREFDVIQVNRVLTPSDMGQWIVEISIDNVIAVKDIFTIREPRQSSTWPEPITKLTLLRNITLPDKQVWAADLSQDRQHITFQEFSKNSSGPDSISVMSRDGNVEWTSILTTVEGKPLTAVELRFLSNSSVVVAANTKPYGRYGGYILTYGETGKLLSRYGPFGDIGDVGGGIDDLSTNGTAVVFTATNRIFTMEAGSIMLLETDVLKNAPRFGWEPCLTLSRDGNLIAISASDRDSGNAKIVVIERSGQLLWSAGIPDRLAQYTGTLECPAISPDGNRVAVEVWMGSTYMFENGALRYSLNQDEEWGSFGVGHRTSFFLDDNRTAFIEGHSRWGAPAFVKILNGKGEIVEEYQLTSGSTYTGRISLHASNEGDIALISMDAWAAAPRTGKEKYASEFLVMSTINIDSALAMARSSIQAANSRGANASESERLLAQATGHASKWEFSAAYFSAHLAYESALTASTNPAKTTTASTTSELEQSAIFENSLYIALVAAAVVLIAIWIRFRRTSDDR
jgi:hypothetical protein